jgi:hypothetical protein
VLKEFSSGQYLGLLMCNRNLPHIHLKPFQRRRRRKKRNEERLEYGAKGRKERREERAV